MAKTGTGEATYLHLRLFMEGMEVPVIGASVNVSLNQPASATIQVVPSDALSALLPRTVVHLFFLDAAQFKGSGLDAPLDHNYKLLFCGEVFDISFAKSGHGSRTVNLRCMDFSNVWDTNYSYIMRYAPASQEDPSGGVIKNVTGFVGGGASDGLSTPNPFDDIVNSPADVIRQMALSSGPGNPSLPGRGSILGGLLSILELLSGIQGLYMGINPWATIEERRCRVMDSIVSDSGSTAKNLFDQQVFADWLQQRTGTAGSVISFRQIIGIICQYIYYGVVTNVTAPYIPGNDGKGRPGRLAPEYEVTGVDGSSSEAGDANAIAAESVEGLANYYGNTNANTLAVLAGKIKGIDTNFWKYVQALLTEIDRNTEGKTYPSNGSEIKYRITSGWRNVETQIRLAQKAGYVRTREAAAKSAHTKGFAVDISPIVPYPGGGLGTMPYYTGATSAESLEKEIPAGDNHAVGRFRKAMQYLSRQVGGTSFADFDSLVEEIRYNDHCLSTFFGDDETHTATTDEDKESILDAYADSLRDYFYFFNECYKPAVSAASASGNPAGIIGSWGGSWDRKCPLFALFDCGCDPVHVQDAAYKTKTASPLSGYGPPTDVVAKLGEGEIREQLKSFIFRPDIWFCPPPICNVIYPHMYETVNVSRQMMRETTRLQLDAFNQFYESVILSSYYYAPKFPGGNHVVGEGLGSVTKTILMDHEVFSGIVPKMERISEISFYAKSAGQSTDLRTDEALEWETSDALQTTSGTSIVNYGDKVAHFNLLTHRYSARNGGVNGAFNPYLVCGFPAVVLNDISGRNEDAVRTIQEGSRHEDISKKVHWLGMITSLDHAIDQGGARTSATLSYVRSHRIGDDTDDLLSESVTEQGNFVIQDPNYKPSAGSSNETIDFGLGTLSLSSDAAVGATPSSTDGWGIALVLKTMGYSNLFKFFVDVGLVIPATNPNFQANYDASTHTTSDFSRNGNAIASLSGFPSLSSAEWSGNSTWVVFIFTATSPGPPLGSGDFLSGLGQFVSAGGDLEKVSILPYSTGSASLQGLDPKTDPKLIGTLTLDPTNQSVLSVAVAVNLPGSELKITYAAPPDVGGSVRGLPVEEAIRPPWVDDEFYSSKVSSSDPTKTNLDLLYEHLFHSPSIIHRLLLADAKPYDDMDVHSVEQAVDFLEADAGQFDTDSARNTYTDGITSRPIASLPDLLAPKGYLPRIESGEIVWKDYRSSTMTTEDYQVSGGFHSNAVTGYRFSTDGTSNVPAGDPDSLRFGSGLEFLDIVALKNSNGTEKFLGSRLFEGGEAKISSTEAVRADPRARRANRVKLYIDDIDGSTAIRHVPAGTFFNRTPSGIGKKG